MTSLSISTSSYSSAGARDTSSATLVAAPVWVCASTDEVGRSLVSLEALHCPCPWSELPDDLREVPVRVERAEDCVLDAELVRFELIG